MIIMIEKVLEKKLMTAVGTKITDVQITGFWQEAEEGKTIIYEPPVINVVVAPREVESESLPQLRVAVNIEILVPRAKDPQGIKKATWSKKIIELLYALNGDYTTLRSETYSEPGLYGITGCKLEQGDNGFDENDKSFYINIPVAFSIVPVST